MRRSSWTPALSFAATGAVAVLLGCDRFKEPAPTAPQILASPQASAILGPSADTYLREGSPNQNFGVDTIVRLQESGKNRAVFRWDRTSIAQLVGRDSLVAATLELTIVENGDNWGSGGRSIDLHQLTVPWTELGATWNCAIDSNTGNQRADCSGATAWVMGGPDSSHPWLPRVTASQIITNGLRGTVVFDVTPDVRAMLTDTGPQNGWILKKSNESLSGRVNFGSRESAHAPRLILNTVVTTPFPATAPDSIPLGYFDDSNLVQSPGPLGRLMVRDVVGILFHPTTDAEQRRSAVSRIGGEVIGGMPLNATDGIYLIRLAHDTSTAGVFSAITGLDGVPGVLATSPDYVDLDALAYQRPTDGPGWRKANWRVNPDSAFASAANVADNWAPTAVAAPLGWGCETGDTGPLMAVVDIGFQDIADLHDNIGPSLTPTSPLDRPGEGGVPHGTWVASVLAARGDDSAGIAGIMWKARLGLIDAPAHDSYGKVNAGAVDEFQAFQNIEIAANAGAQVINLSLGRRYGGPQTKTAASDSEVKAFDSLFVATLTEQISRPSTRRRGGRLRARRPVGANNPWRRGLEHRRSGERERSSGFGHGAGQVGFLKAIWNVLCGSDRLRHCRIASFPGSNAYGERPASANHRRRQARRTFGRWLSPRQRLRIASPGRPAFPRTALRQPCVGFRHQSLCTARH